MARVRSNVVGHVLVALQARLIAAHAPGELIVRIALVHGVATQAGHCASLMAGRFE